MSLKFQPGTQFDEVSPNLCVPRSQHDAVPRAEQRLLLHQLRLQVRLWQAGGHGRVCGLVFLSSVRIQVCRTLNFEKGFHVSYFLDIFRICSGCASVDVPDYKDKDKFKMENLLIGQFMQHITAGPTVSRTFGPCQNVKLEHFQKEKKVPETHSGTSPLPGQVPWLKRSSRSWLINYWENPIGSIRFSL